MSAVILAVHCSAGPDGRPTSDGNVAVLVDGEPVFAIGQERITRRKYDGGFVDAARYAMAMTGLSMSDVTTVAISTFGRSDVPGGPDLTEAARAVRTELGVGPDYQVVPSHHLAHALSAVAQCPYERALVAVIDNEGSILGPRAHPELWRHRLERTSYYLLNGDRLTLAARDHSGPGAVGYGKAYSKITRYVGFRSYQESGKTMALAAFGDPGRFGPLRLFDHDDAGESHCLMHNSADGMDDVSEYFAAHDVDLPPARSVGGALDPVHVDLAAWCQTELERSVGLRVAGLAREHRMTAVVGAGGVFLNSVMNRRLQDLLDTDAVFVPPSPGDQGLALGAAAWAWWQSTGSLPRWAHHPYLGGSFDDAAIATELARHPDLVAEMTPDPVPDAVAELAIGRIVGWFHGRSEYGPRALGNRSILANPADPWVREVLNNLVKHREWFRPYAPVVPAELAAESFELRSPVPFMMHVAPTRAASVAGLPGGVHVDRSARLQTVTARQNATFHRLVTEFRDMTGVPAVLNTSLNVDGMPIVERPADAIECFRRSPGMHALYLGATKVTRAGRRL